MKVLVIPDCHLKPWMFAQADAIMKKGIAEKAVCLMDLADDFGVHDDALRVHCVLVCLMPHRDGQLSHLGGQQKLLCRVAHSLPLLLNKRLDRT